MFFADEKNNEISIGLSLAQNAACSTPILVALLFSEVGREIKSEINVGERWIEYPDLGFHFQIKYIQSVAPTSTYPTSRYPHHTS